MKFLPLILALLLASNIALAEGGQGKGPQGPEGSGGQEPTE